MWRWATRGLFCMVVAYAFLYGIKYAHSLYFLANHIMAWFLVLHVRDSHYGRMAWRYLANHIWHPFLSKKHSWYLVIKHQSLVREEWNKWLQYHPGWIQTGKLRCLWCYCCCLYTLGAWGVSNHTFWLRLFRTNIHIHISLSLFHVLSLFWVIHALLYGVYWKYKDNSMVIHPPFLLPVCALCTSL